MTPRKAPLQTSAVQPKAQQRAKVAQRHRTRYAWLAQTALAGALVSGCAEQEIEIQQDERAPIDRSLQGELELRLQGLRNISSVLDLRVYRPTGAEIASGVIPIPSGETAASSALVLPAGLGYTLTLAGYNQNNELCTGSAMFNVIAGKGTHLRLALVCEAANKGGSDGGVHIEVEVGAGHLGECPEISFVSALPPKLNVGKVIRLRSAASQGSASFRWSASSGRFSDPQGADTDFSCTQTGPATVTLAVVTRPGCEDRHEIVVDCLATADDSPGDGPEGSTDGGSGGNEGTGEGEDGGGATDDAGKDGPGGGDSGASKGVLRRLSFRPSVGSEDFECGRSYNDLGSTRVKGTVSDFRFYVHNVRLIAADGSEVPFELDDRAQWQGSGVALIDFEGGPDSGCYGGTKGVNTELTGIAPKGDYRGLRFSIGVPSPLSHADPSTQTAPLTAGGMAWSWLAGYKFLKFELGSGVLHVGSTSCTGTPPDKINCRRANRPEIEVLDFDPYTQVINTDIAAAFRSSDLDQHPSCHSTGEACAPLFQEVGLNFEDGSPTATQSVFRAR